MAVLNCCYLYSFKYCFFPDNNYNFTYDWSETTFEEFSEVTSIELDITIPAQSKLEIRKFNNKTQIFILELNSGPLSGQLQGKCGLNHIFTNAFAIHVNDVSILCNDSSLMIECKEEDNDFYLNFIQKTSDTKSATTDGITVPFFVLFLRTGHTTLSQAKNPQNG